VQGDCELEGLVFIIGKKGEGPQEGKEGESEDSRDARGERPNSTNGRGAR